MPTLLVVVASTRPGRVGGVVADWFVRQARDHAGFDVRVADLAELDLPLLDEPNHPRLGEYTREHTRRWSALVDAADAFVFVMPEYNYSFTAPLKNALDYLHREWAYKPVGFVSYGGVSGGLRAVQAIKGVVTTLNLFPLPAGVALPFVASSIRDRELQPNDQAPAAAKAMLDELVRVAAALATLRSVPEAGGGTERRSR